MSYQRGGRGGDRGGRGRGDRGGRGGGYGGDRGGRVGGYGGGRGGASQEVRVFRQAILCLSVYLILSCGPNYLAMLLTRIGRDSNFPFTPPEKVVMDIENSYMENSTGIGSLRNVSLASQFPQRPSHGTQGRRIAVYANYSKLMAQENLSRTRYNVDVNPVPPGRKLRRILQIFFEQPEFTGVATDFKTLIISRSPLNIPDDYQTSIAYRAEGDDGPTQNASRFTVRVMSPTPIPVSELVKYLSATRPSPIFPGKEELLNVLNALLAFYPAAHDGVSNVGRRYFTINKRDQNVHNCRTLDGGIELLRGFFQSVRPATGGLLLNVNVTHGIFLEPEPLPILLPRLGTGDKSTLQKKLRLVRVKVTHIAPKRSKNFLESRPSLRWPRDTTAVKKQSTPGRQLGAGPKEVSFWLGDDSPQDGDDKGKDQAKGKGKGSKPKPTGSALPTNTYITVFDYFKISKSAQFRYSKSPTLVLEYPSIRLDERFPVVNVGSPDRPSYLPADVCEVLPGQVIKRRLSPSRRKK